MAVDVTSGKGRELLEALRIAREHAGEVHELGEADHLRVAAQGDQVRSIEARSRRFEMRGRDAARQLDAQVHAVAIDQSRK